MLGVGQKYDSQLCGQLSKSFSFYYGYYGVWLITFQLHPGEGVGTFETAEDHLPKQPKQRDKEL